MSGLIHYIPYSWHEEYGKAFDLDVYETTGNILLLRDPLDRAIEEVWEKLDTHGNIERLTFEEHLFMDKNPICRHLGLNTKDEIFEQIKTYDFIALTYHIVWPQSANALWPLTKTKLNEFYTPYTAAQRLSEFVGKPVPADFNISLKYHESNAVDIAMRADYQAHNNLDYDLIQIVRELLNAER